jgi:hypothetical protein
LIEAGSFVNVNGAVVVQAASLSMIDRKQQDMHMIRHDGELEQLIFRAMMMQQVLDDDVWNAGTD